MKGREFTANDILMLIFSLLAASWYLLVVFGKIVFQLPKILGGLSEVGWVVETPPLSPPATGLPLALLHTAYHVLLL